MGRSGCCTAYNLMKVNPATGAIIWKIKVPGSGTPSSPPVCQIEPLRGTNDIVVLLTGSGGSNGAAQLARISSAGNVVWNYTGDSYYDHPVYGGTPRTFGCANGVIGYRTINSTNYGLSALDYNGNVLWRLAPVNTGGVTPNTVVSPQSIVTWEVLTPAQNIGQYNPSTGALLSAGGSTFSIIDMAADQSSGNFLNSNQSFIPTGGGTQHGPVIVNYSTLTPISRFQIAYPSLGIYPNGARARWSAGKICGQFNYSNVSMLSLYNPSSTFVSSGITYCQKIWDVSTLFGVAYTPSDMDIDSTGVYVGITSQSISGNYYNIFKVDPYYGNLLWAQNLRYYTVTSPGSVRAVCISDEGYLYCGGS